MSTQTFPPSHLDSVNNFTVNHSSREFTPLQSSTQINPSGHNPTANGVHTNWNRNASVFVPKKKTLASKPQQQFPDSNNDFVTSKPFAQQTTPSKKIPIIDPKTNQEIDLSGSTSNTSLSTSPSSLSTSPLSSQTNGGPNHHSNTKANLATNSPFHPEHPKKLSFEPEHVNEIQDSSKRTRTAIPIFDPRTNACIYNAVQLETTTPNAVAHLEEKTDLTTNASNVSTDVEPQEELKKEKLEEKDETITQDVANDAKELDSAQQTLLTTPSDESPNTQTSSPEQIETVAEEVTATLQTSTEEVASTVKEEENKEEKMSADNVGQTEREIQTEKTEIELTTGDENKDETENVQAKDFSDVSVDNLKDEKSFSKRIYDRDFLLKFQSTCTEKPENLPAIEVTVGESQAWQRTPQNNNRYRDSSRSTPKSGRREAPVPREPAPAPTPRWTGNTKAGDPENETLRKITAFLNKITAENFDSVVKKIQKTPIPTEHTLVLIIDQVFIKAVSEVQFSSLYALLCGKINEITELKFRELILSKCQKEFENRPPSLVTGIEKPSEELDELELKRRQRIFGNMRFIGELFNKRVLHPMVIAQCLNKLISTEPIEKIPSEDIECLCLMLKTCGIKLEEAGPKYRGQLNALFERINTIYKANAHGHRIHFTLMDLIDLKNSAWNAIRAKEDAKKTIDNQKNLEKEREREREKEAGVRPANKPSSEGATTDEWKSTVRPKTTQKKKDERKTPPQPPQPSLKDSKKDSQKQAPSNLFSLLENSNSKGPTTNPPKKTGKAQPKAQPKQSQQQQQTQSQPQPQPQVAPQLTKEEINSKLDLIIEEYLGSGELEDAVEYIKKINIPKDLLLAAFEKILFVLVEQTKEDPKKDLISLFSQLAKQNVFSAEHFKTGFQGLFETLEDLAIDVPLAPDNAGSLFAQNVVENTLELSFLKQFGSIWTASNLGQKFFAVTMKQLLDFTDEGTVKELVREAKIKIVEFMPEYDNSGDSMIAFLNKHTLSFLSEFAIESS